MRIIHTADLHLGTELYGRPDPTTGLSTRSHDFLQAFDQVIDATIEGGADLFLFAGDAYKTRDPNPTYQRSFAQRIGRLYREGIPVFLLTGNHDMPNMMVRATSLDIFGAIPVQGIYVSNKPGVTVVHTRTAGPLSVISIPWISRSTLFTKEDLKNLSLADLDGLTIERISAFMEDALAKIDPTIPAVLAVHGTIAGAIFGSERQTMLGHDLTIPRSLISHPALSYVALGHIHKHQRVGDDPPAYYSGSLERIDFGEERDKKGFMQVDIDGPGTPGRARFIEVAVRPFQTVEIKETGSQPIQDALDAVNPETLDGKIVRVLVHLTAANEASFQERAIMDALKGSFYVRVQRIVERNGIESGRRSLTSAMTPLQALDRWMVATQVTPERQIILRQYAEPVVAEQTTELAAS